MSEGSPPPLIEVGTTASDDLFDFIECFLPMAEKSDLGVALRKRGFKLADPNGNGLCSLAELETFVLQTLMAAYPKDKTKFDERGDPLERGRDLWTAFRPSYIRAYDDAKDYKADTGKILEGTKKCTDDDFVTKGEFRYFCAYLCIYGTMFDAFAKIDGGGAGRDANDDRRIELNEWLAGYRWVTEHGLVCFKDIKNDDEARAVFAEMDDNGGGIVLLDEWCDYIKEKEVQAGTQVGKLLDADEAAPTPPPEPEKKRKEDSAKRADAAAVDKDKGSAAAEEPDEPEEEEVAEVEAGDLYDFIECFKVRRYFSGYLLGLMVGEVSGLQQVLRR